MKNTLLSLLFSLLIVCCTSPEQKVHLKGELDVKKLGTTNVTMAYNGKSSLIGNSKNIIIHTDENGRFDTVISLEKPEYYSISRNTLYLSPGDDLDIFVTTFNTEARFAGVGAEANNYMKFRLFPKGGSFIESGRNIRKSFEATKDVVDSLAAIRYAELKALKNVSKDFKELEKARITADVINSYIYYMSYAKEVAGLSQDEIKQFRDKHIAAITQYVNPLYKEINDDRYLDVAVVRDVLSHRDNSAWFEGVAETSLSKELYQASKYVSRIDNGLTADTLNKIVTAVSGFGNAEIRHELDIKIEKALTLQAGKSAFDFEFIDTTGNIKHLSDFKGKVIYIDFWATWCGPCIAEAPFMEALAEKFKDKDIVFLPVSTDNTTSVWLNYLAKHEKKLVQYHTSDLSYAANWSIRYIPRFVIIDRNFNITDSYAPRPSEEKTEEILTALL
jgi:thiol-disulfide isomerase/thioredoxin